MIQSGEFSNTFDLICKFLDYLIKTEGVIVMISSAQDRI